MLRLSTQRICLQCRLQAARPALSGLQLQTQRYASQVFKKRPARLELSDTVAKATPKASAPKRRQNSPWGNTNLRKAGIRGVAERDEDSKNSSKLRGGKDKKDDKDKGFHALKMHSALSAIPYNTRLKVKSAIKDLESFGKFPLLPVIQNSIGAQALPGLVDFKPTPAQRVAIPALLGVDSDKGAAKRKPTENGREEFLLAAETGSGKTLAYVLPIIDAVKRAEANDEEFQAYEKVKQAEREGKVDNDLGAPSITDMPHPHTGRPRAIILVPTSELVEQVGALVKSLSHTVKFKAALLSSTYSANIIRRRLFSPGGVDIVISTPHLLSSITENDPNVLSRVTHMVVDEADSLLDRGFMPLTTSILDRASPSLKQLVLCTATIPRSMESYMRKRHPNIRRLVTPNLHAIPRRVQLGVIDVNKEPYHGNKDLACADTIWTIGKAALEHEGPERDQADVKRIVVFVNEREKSVELAEYLRTKKIDAIALNRDTSDQRTGELLATFTSPEKLSVSKEEKGIDSIPFERSEREEARKPTVNRKNLNNVKVLVTTDLGSRGIDTVAVRHVVLYDVPHSTVDFIHRLGRTGRMGRRGRGIVLVGKGDRRDVVREVQEGMYMGQALI